MKWIPYGPNAWLLEFADRVGEEAFLRGRAIAVELERQPVAGLIEYVPGFTTVLFELDHQIDNVTSFLATLTARFENAFDRELPPAPLKEIPVRYDGEDLERVARARELTCAEVRERHAAPVYKVYLLGFSPGFPYLGELDRRLHTPRLPSPRPRVRAGSVAIGGEHTGIYTVDSPGGWNIIGWTPLEIFDLNRADPGSEEDAFLLRAGDRVKFVE